MLVYDDTWLREPNLLVPGRKPIGPVRYRDSVSGIFWMLNRSLVANTGDRMVLTSTDWRSTPKGPALQQTDSTAKAECTTIGSRPMYGFVWHFFLEVAELNSSTTKKEPLIAFTSNIRLAYGAVTGYLTDETLTLFDTLSTKRTGIDETISIGEHVVAVVWNGQEYEIWLDGRLPAQLAAAGGHTDLATVTEVEIQGRLYSANPRFDTVSFQLLDSPIVGYGKTLSRDPYSLLEAA